MTDARHWVLEGETFGDEAAADETGLPLATVRDMRPGERRRTVEGQILSCEAGWPEPTEHEPSERRLVAWVNDSVVEATDGCQVEPDGVCPHGHPSWLLKLGLI